MALCAIFPSVLEPKFEGKLKIRATTHFLIPCEDSDGKLVYELNIFQTEWKLIAEYVEDNPLRIADSLRLRFESKHIFVGEPSELDKQLFEQLCFRHFDRKLLKRISELPNKLLV